MALPTPKLDDREWHDLVEEAKRRIQQRCPQWTDFNPSDPGGTLVELMAWMTEVILYRLNRVPERNFIKFLELMGVRLKAAEASHAWVRFNVTPAADGQPVTAGTKLSTRRTEKDDAIPFETRDVLYPTVARVVALWSRYDGRQKEQLAGVDVVGEPPQPPATAPAGVPLFFGLTQVVHALQLGDSGLDFGDAKRAALLQLRLAVHLERRLSGAVYIEWERWNDARWEIIQPTQDGTDGFRRSGEIVFETFPQERGKLDGKCWLRARMVGIEAETLPRLRSLTRNLELRPGHHLLPDKAYHGGSAAAGTTPNPGELPSIEYQQLDLNREFYPFGDRAQAGDMFYLRSFVFARRAARVTLSVMKSTLYDAGSADMLRDLKLELRWEYFAQSGRWEPLGASTPAGERDAAHGFGDTTHALTENGAIRFTVPDDVAPCVIQNESGPYIRARIASGHYGEEKGRAPLLSDLSLNFADPMQAWETAARENYSAVEVLTPQIRAETAIEPFVMSDDRDPTLWLGFDPPLPENLQRIYFAFAAPCPRADAMLRWEYGGSDRWHALHLLADDTNGFSESGAISFIGPYNWAATRHFGKSLHWLRLRFTVGETPAWPVLKGIYLNVVEAIQAETIADEILGSSTDTPAQTFHFTKVPLLPNPEVMVREADGRESQWVAWSEVENFDQSDDKSRHYMLDRGRGALSFGDGRHGRIPPPGADSIKARRYQITNGARGNVAPNTIAVLEKGLPGIDRVTNVEAAAGGADAETIEQAKRRGPVTLRHRDRAVTGDDFKYLAKEASLQVAKAHCFVEPHRVTVVVIPDGRTEKLQPDTQLIRRVTRYLNDRRLIATLLRVTGPQYVDIRVEFDLVPEAHYINDFVRLREEADRTLRAFVHPLTGGSKGEGWDMGRTLHKSELYYKLEQIRGVEFVDNLRLWYWRANRAPGVVDEVVSEDYGPPVENIYIDEIAPDTFPYFREIIIHQG